MSRLPFSAGELSRYSDPIEFCREVLKVSLLNWEQEFLFWLRKRLRAGESDSSVYPIKIIETDVCAGYLSAYLTRFFFDTCPGTRGMVIGPDPAFVERELWHPLMEVTRGSVCPKGLKLDPRHRRLSHEHSDSGWRVDFMSGDQHYEAFAGMLSEDAFVIIHDSRRIDPRVREIAHSVCALKRGIWIDFERR